MTDDTPADALVWASQNYKTAGKIHTDEDCPALQQIETIQRLRRGEREGWPLCTRCSGDWEDAQHEQRRALRYAISAGEVDV